MSDFVNYLYRCAKSVISSIAAEDIYTIAFFVYPNECYEYGGLSNLPEFKVLYNTESDCPGSGPESEERWNPAFWGDHEYPIITFDSPNEGADRLLAWFRETGLQDVGTESEDAMYDENCRYIGKGPVGTFELVQAAAAVAKRLQTEDFFQSRFGRRIPILILDFEMTWFYLDATREANIHGEADDYLSAADSCFEDDLLLDLDGAVPMDKSPDSTFEKTDMLAAFLDQVLDQTEPLDEDQLRKKMLELAKKLGVDPDALG